MAKKKISMAEEALFLGLGMASMAKDKLEEMMEYLVKKTKLAKNQTALKKKLMAAGEKEYSTLMKMAEKSMNKMDKAMPKKLKKMKKSVVKKLTKKTAPKKKR